MADDSARGRAARAQLAAVARAYYLQDRSMVQISDEQGISRFRVARLLARAREEGVVRIEVDDAGLPDDALADRLQEALGLRACAVVRSHGDADAVRQQVGAAAAELLQSTLSAGEVLGVAWGRTLTATTSQLERLPRLTIVQLTGVVSGDLASSPTEVARQAAARSGGDVHPVFAPLVVQDRATAASLRAHPGIAAAVERFGAVTTALLSVGSWDTQDTQLRDVLDLEDLATAITGGCVADIAGILLTEDGAPVDEAFQERCIGITYEQLRAVPRVVAVAAGASKAAAVRAVVRAGLVSELVTDHALAEAVLAGPVVAAHAQRGGRGA